MASHRVLSKELLCESLNSVLNPFKIDSLDDGQLSCVHQFLMGREVFVNRPTGSGKSICFQVIPLVEKWLATNVDNRIWKKNAILIVITPLVSLMKDQVNYLNSIGIKSAYVGIDQNESVLKKIVQGQYELVYMSPEATLSIEHWRSMLQSPIYQENIVGIAVDEVHCVTQWGNASNNKEKTAFRRWYSRLNELKSFIPSKIPFMALTATATKETRGKIVELLSMRNPFELVESPYKANITFAVQEMDNSTSLTGHFQWLIDEIKNEKSECKRTIIYCQTIKQVSILFQVFSIGLGDHIYDQESREPKAKTRYVEMMHSQTPNDVKNFILEQFSHPDSHVRVLVATIAYGMGVNCTGVTRVIHFGPSKNVESYIQEVGRCGRSGEQSYTLLLNNSVMMRVADNTMKAYVRPKETVCRRQYLYSLFEGNIPVSSIPVGHNCCDVCAERCKCNDGNNCNTNLHCPITSENISSNILAHLPRRTLTEEQNKHLYDKLLLLEKQILKRNIICVDSHDISIISCPNTLKEFTKVHIQQIMKNAEIIFTIKDVMNNVDIWRRTHAIDVLSVFQDIFHDVEHNIEEETESDESDEEMDVWDEIADDCSFIDLLNNMSQLSENTILTDSEYSVEGHSTNVLPAVDHVIENISLTIPHD